jgi:putative nucleotidyltransferase with HDIG domain
MSQTSRDDRWRGRPTLAFVLRLGILLVPIGACLVATALIRPLLPRPHAWLSRVGWWTSLLLVGVGTAVAVERVVRRFIPIVMLLKLSMLFPDRAPSRFQVAREAGSVRRLRTRLAELQGNPEGETESLSAATILALATALQSHDRRTRGHAERVRVFTDLLGEELKLSPEDRYRLRWAALLHDIGKLTIEARILNKPGALDDREWASMRTHPLEGARIARPLLEWLGPWAGAIEEHHERYDGGGYPAGLAGESISFAGRIVAAADAYDTMTAARSYKKPMAVRAARAELARCAGSQFDPIVVRAFFAISLPRLLWKTGPLSFLVQLPFLARLQEIGQQTLAAAAQGATVATVVAGAAALTVSGAASPTPGHFGAPGPPTGSRPGIYAPAAPSPTAGTATPGGPSPTPGGPSPRPSPRPSPGPSPSPSPSPAPSPQPSPQPSPSPTLPLPPLPSISPLPLPSISPLPLPTPSLPLGATVPPDARESD